MITTFFLDLWNDMREKRLWPVAVGILAAIVAVPAVLLKPASDGGTPVPGPTASAAPGGVQLPALNVDVNAQDQGSKLDTFTNHDPFKPMKDLSTTQTASSSSPTGSSAPSSAAKVSSGGGSGSGSSSSSLGSSLGSGSGSSPSAGSHLVSQHTTTTSWIYTATFKFGTPAHMKTMKNVQPFTMLPDENTPTLIFASAGADGKSAIFYIQDTTFQPTGEGKCNAPGAQCRFVTLSTDTAHDEETFLSSDGMTEYDVQLLSINRKTISNSGSSNSSSKKSPSAPKGKQVAGAGKTAAKTSNLDFLPVLLGFSSITTTGPAQHK